MISSLLSAAHQDVVLPAVNLFSQRATETIFYVRLLAPRFASRNNLQWGITSF